MRREGVSKDKAKTATVFSTFRAGKQSLGFSEY